MSKTALITGNSSGLGLGLTGALLEKGYRIYGCSRRGCPLQHERLHDIRFDMNDHAWLAGFLKGLVADADHLDLVVLNAGMLGDIRDLHATETQDAKQVMDVNLWNNKAVMDWLHGWGKPIGQIVMISSGAAVNGSRGWSGYALSKAALNMLAKLYSHEFPDTHISAVAPGLVGTEMMDYLCTEADADQYPALQRLKQANEQGDIPSPRQTAEQMLHHLETFREHPSGSFLDIRQL